MGRLQKKKTVGQKKKKKEKLNIRLEATQEIDGSSDKKIVPFSGFSKDGKKHQSSRKQPSNLVKSVKQKQGNKFLDQTMQFFREVKTELKKVTWPSRTQTVGSTIVVIILVIIVSVFLGIVDYGLGNLVRVIIR